MEPKTNSLRGRHSVLRAALGLLLAAVTCGASAQIIPGLNTKSNISAYATFPFNLTPDYRYFGTPVVAGYSLGGFYQTPYLIGVEVRGTIQRRLNPQHQESALIGPRVAMRFGPFMPYASFLGGAGNGWRFREPPISGEKAPKPVEGLGGQWTLLGGLDIHLSHHIGIRVGEISYSKLYLKDWSLNPLNFTAGVVYRIN
jgi:hypothetical protein